MVKYNRELLDECLVRDHSTLIGEYEKLNRDTKIRYKCNCGNEGEKTFRRVYLSGGLYCEACCKVNLLKKSIDTNLEKYGIDFHTQSKEVKDKAKETVLKKYGVNCYIQSSDFKYKTKATNLKKYGVEFYTQTKEVKDKAKKTIFNKYGVENIFQCEEIKDKIKDINIKKYGVANPMQNSMISEKSLINSHKNKDYILPSGNILKCQGYENFALDKIIKEWKIEEYDIIVSRDKVPEIWWLDKDEKRRRYFVDIYIPSKNLIIEVKSIWTITLNKDNIMSKLNASKDLGFNTLLWVFDKKGNLCEEHN